MRAWACSALVLGALVGCNEVPQQEVLGLDPLPFDPAFAEIPSDAELLAQIKEATEFRLRANFDRNFDAVDPGEGIEHATITQLAMNQHPPSPAMLLVVGDELFDYAFRVEDGLGNRLAGRPGIRGGSKPAPNMRRVHKSEFGGPDSYSCATCHSKGGPDGAGTNTQNAYLRGNGNNTRRADERNAPHLLGLGAVSALAFEMTESLKSQRDAAVARAIDTATALEQPLEANGVSFGKILISETGVVDTRSVQGVDADLVIRPFGWKGHKATLRGMIEESFRIHMGILSMREQEALRDGELDKIDYGDGTWFDADRDGHHLELEAGMLSTMVAYLSQLQIPVIRPPLDPALLEKSGEGRLLFDEVGCGECHRPELHLSNPVVRIAPKEKRFSEAVPIEINVATDGDHPKIDPIYAYGQSYRVSLFSDLRRHDMGEKLTSGYKQGTIPKSVFLTRPLWGLAGTGPFLHDGRAPTVHDAILWHGGEAATARELYNGLEDSEQQALRVFLLSLDRKPRLFVP